MLNRLRRCIVVWACACLALLPAMPHAQDAVEHPFKKEEIEALVAPIALYSDGLLSQVLMAATYPLEVVQAARWMKANPKVTGEAAVKAVEGEPWDVSVKSLVAFPQILEPMNEKLDWTQKLGDAFLAQKADVMDAIQRLREQAKQAGTLKSNEQQTVIVEPAPPAQSAAAASPSTQQTIIKIEPANPQVIYVPAYNPTIVYGTWGYPAYPPYYWPPPPLYYPGGYLAAGFAFGVGVAAAGAIFGGWNWHNHDVNVNINKAVNVDRNYNSTRVNNIQNGSGNWQHDASHRKGVAYRDQATRERVGATRPGSADARRDYRGKDGPGSNRPATADRQRPGGGAATTADRSYDRPTGTLGSKPGGGGGSIGNGTRPDPGAFQGVGGGAAANRDFNRGQASVSSMNAYRPSSGGGQKASAATRPSSGGARPSGGGARRR